MKIYDIVDKTNLFWIDGITKYLLRVQDNLSDELSRKLSEIRVSITEIDDQIHIEISTSDGKTTVKSFPSYKVNRLCQYDNNHMPILAIAVHLYPEEVPDEDLDAWYLEEQQVINPEDYQDLKKWLFSDALRIVLRHLNPTEEYGVRIAERKKDIYLSSNVASDIINLIIKKNPELFNDIADPDTTLVLPHDNLITIRIPISNNCKNVYEAAITCEYDMDKVRLRDAIARFLWNLYLYCNANILDRKIDDADIYTFVGAIQKYLQINYSDFGA